MTSSTVISTKSSSNLSSRQYLVRIKVSDENQNDYDQKIVLRIYDNAHRASEEIILKKSAKDNQSSNQKNIQIFQIETEQKLSDNIQRLKLHSTNSRNQSNRKTNNKIERIFLNWIELTDKNTKQIFCFPVDEYLPVNSGDVLELTEVQQDKTCEDNNQENINTKTDVSNQKTNPQSKSTDTSTNSSEKDNKSVNSNEAFPNEDPSKYAKLYDVRTKTGQQGFLGIKSLVKVNVYLKLFDVNEQSSETLSLIKSRLHHKPFRSNQTDQFQIGTNSKLGLLKKVQIWHDGKKGTKLHWNTLEITDLTNGQIYCFQIKEYLDGDTKLLLTDYDNRRCIKMHSEPQQFSIKQTEDSQINPSNIQQTTNTQLLQTPKDDRLLTTSDSATSSVSNLNQTLFKVRTRVGHKGFLSLGMGGTDARVNIRMHQNDTSTNDIPLNNSLTHHNPFEAGHTDVFEIGVPQTITSPDKIEIFHNGKKNDGLFLKWIEIMNMKTLERKCFPVNRWLDLNEGDKKTHIIVTNFTLNESCEENEYRERHTHDDYKTEYAVRTKTGRNQPANTDDTNANIYLKIYNNKKIHTEDMLLSNSKNHTNPFQPGKIDKFDVGSTQLMDDKIDKIELWHDNKSNFNWFCEWIEVKNKKTGTIQCFSVNRLLSKKSSDDQTKVVLTIHSNYSCDKIENELQDLAKNVSIDDQNLPTNKLQYLSQQRYHAPNQPDYIKTYIITTKTGKKMLSGTDANIYVRLYDQQNNQSEDILLEQSVTNKHPFEKHAIDEFHTGTMNDMGDLQKIHLWHTGGKNQGWNVKWIQIQDVDQNKTYCFPVNKWLDSNSGDKTTQVELTEFTINEPCSSTTDRKDYQKLQKSAINPDDDEQEKSQNPSSQFKQTYHVETKTGKRGFLGLSPTGTNAKVYIRIHDKNGQISEPIELQKSTNHKNKFERGQTDGFDVGSFQSLDGIDKIELWHNDSGMGHGWFADYISVTDNKTGEEACFFIGQYLNNGNGGVEDKHLILDKQPNDQRPCREHQFDAKESTIQQPLALGNQSTPFTQTYRVETKTGHTGLFGLGAAGTNAPVFIRIHDNNDKVSEPIQLKQSLRHKNKFERNQTDIFDVGTYENLDGVKKVGLWHEGDKHDGWQVDYINIIDNKTDTSYCFPVNKMLDKNSGLKDTQILLENPSIDVPCSDEYKSMKKSTNLTSTSRTKSEKENEMQRNFSIRTKTGNQVEAGSTTPIHIQLFDDQDQQSEDIRLKRKDHDKHNFVPGAIDEFEVTSLQPLSNQLTGIRLKHKAEKYQGWYAEWVEVTDLDNDKTYCFPIQRWIDKGENDKQTDVYFDKISDKQCDSLADTMPVTDRRSIRTTRQTPAMVSSQPLASQSQTSEETPGTPYKSTYHVKTKTGKKGFLGLSPTGTNSKVFMRVIDKNGNISEDLQLHSSTDHKNKFERGQTDEFDIGSNQELNGIDRIELWTSGKGFGNGWYPKYIEVTDNKTGDIACFPINQYLNEKNGGIEGNPLKLKRITGDRPCQELVEQMIENDEEDNNDDETEQQKISSPNMKSSTLYKNTFSVITKTGHTGFLGLGAAGTNAPVFIRIHDTKGKISEAIQLKHSTRHKNKFERNQTDQFDIGTRESLAGVSRIELWHEGDKNDGWQVEYVQVNDNQTNTTYCFPVYSMLDKNSGLKQSHILLEKPLINVSCPEQTEALKRDRINTDLTSSKKNKKEKYERNFTIRTKTGNQIEAGSTTPIHVQLFDDQDQNSEDIRLKHKDREKHNFEPGAIDEFEVTSNQPLSNQLTGLRIKHHAEKYQGWYCEWIEIKDDDYGKTYCYPIQRWIDKGENDKKTDVYFTDTSDGPCDSLANTMTESQRYSVPVNRKAPEIESNKSKVSTGTTPITFQSTYHVETKTGKKGFLGLSPTGTNADVFVQIIDLDGNKSEPIQLKKSIDHKNKFESDKIDEFDIGSTKSLNGIKQLEIWTDGKGFGHGWYADYVAIKDNKTGEEACFLIGQYLNKTYGGVANNHLVLDKQTDDIPCREKYRSKEDETDTVETRQMKAVKPIRAFEQDSSPAISYKRTYHVDTKTGQKGLFGLSPTGTNADVYLRIHDKSGQISEPISLRRSTKHKNPFEKGKIDSFDIGTKESLESLTKIELYHNETGLGHGWNVQYVNILDNTNGHTYCFQANKWLNNTEHLILDDYLLDKPCEDMNKQLTESKSDTKDKQTRSFSVQTKTGSEVEAGSTTPIYIRLYDDRSQKTEKIRLKHKDKEGHHFEPGSIDQFQIQSDKPFETLNAIDISHTAEKYQGWYGEWISVTDNDKNETYCFPLQRWLDKGELDGKTDIYLQRTQNTIPCEQLPDTMQRRTLSKATANQRSMPKDTSVDDYKSNYNVQIKTGKKGFLGLSPTGTDANVFIQIHDQDGQISEPIQLKNSLDHKNKFARGHTDDFEVGSTKDLNGVERLELWTDGKGFGSGWYPEYVQLTDQKTGEVCCFVIDQYLNERYGGLKDNHLIFNKQKDIELCNELKKKEQINNKMNQGSINVNDDDNDNDNNESEGRFQVEIKTGHTGFLGLGGAGTDAPVFIQLYDSNEQQSQPIQLKKSTRHKNKFERNQRDHFIVNSDEPLNDISKIDLWHEGDKNDGWQVDYINIIDNKTNTSYCFPVNAMLDKNSGLNRTMIHLENPSINVSCKEQAQTVKKSHSYTSASKRLKADKSTRSYTVRTKTGNHPSAGSTSPIQLRLIDINDKKSKEISLEKKDIQGHHFAPGTIDEFNINLSESLSTIKGVKLSVDADKYQGWYGEWISITDNDKNETYCFPIQRWLDKGESDHKTHVTLYQQSTTPCDQLEDSMQISSNQDDQLSNEKLTTLNTLTANRQDQFEIRLQTGEKSLKGKAGRDANVYMNIYDKTDQKIVDAVKLINSKTHQTPFQKHHTDKFILNIPNVKISEVTRIDLYQDGHNDGWFCDFVELKNVQTNEFKCFTVHQWLDETNDKKHFSMTDYQQVSCTDKEHYKTIQYYTVRIKTNTTNLTSENSIEIFLKLFGKYHQTEHILLDETIDNQKAFQRNNSIDIFEIRTTTKINSLEKLEFYYDIKLPNGKLSLEWIEITNLANGILLCFPINRTLIQSDSNKHTQQIITLNQSNKKSCA